MIDLDAVRHNFRELVTRTPGPAHMAIVKADAYGHGHGPVALAALEAGADWLGIAQLQEALDLRALLDARGVRRRAAPIFTWIAGPDAPWEQAIRAELDLSVSTPDVLVRIAAAARAAGRPARIHLKIDTGMSRAGATAKDFPALAAAAATAQQSGTVRVVGLWSHLARADDPTPEGEAQTREQVREFRDAQRACAAAGVTPRLRHIAATSGALWHPDARFDLVRLGIGIYGLSPNPEVATSQRLGIRPAMRLEAPLIQVKTIEAGRPVSYGGTWRAPTRRWLGLVPLGYADGIDRHASNRGPVSVRAQGGPIATHVVGRVCMDQFVVDLGEARDATPPARPGDVAVLFGDPASGVPSADEWARACGTINYEIVTRIGPRVPRVYRGARA